MAALRARLAVSALALAGAVALSGCTTAGTYGGGLPYQAPYLYDTHDRGVTRYGHVTHYSDADPDDDYHRHHYHDDGRSSSRSSDSKSKSSGGSNSSSSAKKKSSSSGSSGSSKTTQSDRRTRAPNPNDSGLRGRRSQVEAAKKKS